MSIHEKQLLDDVYLIFARYDKDGDGKLNINEFSRLLVPKELTDLVASRNDIRLSSDAVDLLRRVMKAHLTIEQSHEYIRIRLQKTLEKENSSLISAFKELDPQ